MVSDLALDASAIRRACAEHGVRRLSLFGSALTDRFDPMTSDVDFLVDFLPSHESLFRDYFDLRAALERIVGRRVDLVDAGAVRNPYFRMSAFAEARELYAA